MCEEVAGLQAYSLQLYQMNSFTVVFQEFYLDAPHVLTQDPPSNFEEPLQCSQHVRVSEQVVNIFII